MASTRLRPPRPPQRVGWGVYILRCVDGTLYTGCTNDLAKRLINHGQRRVKYTRGRLPVELAYWEPMRSGGVVVVSDKDGRSAALRREAAIKRLSRTTKLALCGTAKLC